MPPVRLLQANLVRPTLIGMSAPAFGHVVPIPIPSGSAGVQVLRRVLDSILADDGVVAEPSVSAAAVVADVAKAVPLLSPDLPLEDPRTRLILLTSGTTGDPKGVCLSRDNLLASAAMVRARHPDLLDAPRLVALPVTSAGGLGVVLRAVCDSAEIHTLPSIGGAGRFDAELFAETARPLRDRGAVVSLVPTQLALLLRHTQGLDALRAMRRVFLGGAAPHPRLLHDAREQGIDIAVTYGMTETVGGCVHDGRALDGVSVLVDEDARIRLSGPMTALGYRCRAEDTQAAFRGDTFLTSDLGVLREGLLQVIGRVDDIVQVRGTNVSVGAVERAIVHSELAHEAVVHALPDDVDGHRLIAVVVPERSAVQDCEAIESRIAAAVRADLGSAAVPGDIRMVSVLPYLANGKIDRLAVLRSVTTPPVRDDATDDHR